ncbi:hypothetical protein KSP40_PGU008593 [Platanthera guangdongensis]|uniref:Uncharacterized protein n=1 Tax=Platanthera guangdongensis TaxID=2320717 RepID=A0ABR2LM19_9ASPA
MRRLTPLDLLAAGRRLLLILDHHIAQHSIWSPHSSEVDRGSCQLQGPRRHSRSWSHCRCLGTRGKLLYRCWSAHRPNKSRENEIVWHSSSGLGHGEGGILEKPVTIDPKKVVYIYPTMVIALICALFSVKSDAKKSSRTIKVQPIAKPLKNSINSKLKISTPNHFHKALLRPQSQDEVGKKQGKRGTHIRFKNYPPDR